ncbi:phosphatidylserine decarboxylase family protein [Halobacteriales archaeon QS_9_70_65]|nr:MAG: phosphatidylserine decarboxylase family protein [Halobacteriales archaeon QS_9_70_65]
MFVSPPDVAPGGWRYARLAAVAAVPALVVAPPLAAACLAAALAALWFHRDPENRAPVPGSVVEVTHSPGRHLPAFSKESDRNERVIVDCGDAEVTLVAGAVARRIHPYVEAGDDLDRGQRLGHISFGSRADVLLPPEFDRDDVRVTEGQHVRAGETVVAA